MGGLGHAPCAVHGVVNAFTRRGGDHPCSVADHHHIAAVVPLGQGLERDGRAFAAQSGRIGETRDGAQTRRGTAQGIALVGAAHAHAHGLAVRKHPAIKVGRDLALVIHVAARRVVAGLAHGRLDDLVVREHILGFVRIGDGLARHFRARAVGPHHHAGRHLDRLRMFSGSVFFGRDRGVVHPQLTAVVVLQLVKNRLATHRTRLGGAVAQILVELVAVHHADKAVVDGNIDLVVGGRDHAGTTHLGHQQVVGDVEVLDQARRDRAAAGFGAALAVEQQHAPALAHQIVCGGRARRPSAHHHKVVIGLVHEPDPPLSNTGPSKRKGARCFAGPVRRREATAAETANMSACMPNTAA